MIIKCVDDFTQSQSSQLSYTVKCAQLNFISFLRFSQYFNDNLLFYHIPVKLILQQVHTWSFISTPFSHQDSISVQGKYSILKTASCKALITLIGHISDPILSNVNDYCSIDKPFSIDSFLDWTGLFTHAVNQLTQPLSRL